VHVIVPLDVLHPSDDAVTFAVTDGAAPFTAIEISFSWTRVVITVFSILMLAIAVALSKRGSIAEEQSQTGQAKVAA